VCSSAIVTVTVKVVVVLAGTGDGRPQPLGEMDGQDVGAFRSAAVARRVRPHRQEARRADLKGSGGGEHAEAGLWPRLFAWLFLW
jgi:hypothetical protein